MIGANGLFFYIGLCNDMWADAFLYDADDQDCFVMSFDPQKGNPNLKGNGAEFSDFFSPSNASLNQATTTKIIFWLSILYLLF